MIDGVPNGTRTGLGTTLPPEMHATIHFPNVTSIANQTLGLADVGSFALVLGDALWTDLQTFQLSTNALGEVAVLTYQTGLIDTGTATNITVLNGSFSATILGADTSSGQAFEYDYGASAQVLTGAAATPVEVPALSAWGLVALVTALATAALGAARGRRVR